MRYGEGLIVAHVFLLVSFLVGAAFLPPPPGDAAEERASHTIVRVVCICALGFSLIGFLGLLLALAGVLNLPALLLALPAVAIAAAAFRKERIFTAACWRARLRLLIACWDGPVLAVYYAMLVLAFPAVNLANFGTDPLAYHLAYAADWANAGRLTINPFLDPPFYASNFLLLYSIFMLLKANVFVLFVVWTTALLTALGVFGAIRWTLEDQQAGKPWSALAAGCLTFAVIAPPAYFEWMITAYIDVPIGAFALLAVLAIVLSIREKSAAWLGAAAVIAGFLIGMKVSFVPFVFVFGAAIWAAARTSRLRRSATLAVLAILLAASSPWYVRNFIDAGDPIAPVLNLTLHGHDGLMTRAEADTLASQLHRVRSPQAALTVPYRAFVDAGGTDFVADGVSALAFALYLPGLILLALLPFRIPVPKDTGICVAILCAMLGYWEFTSTTMRYGLLFWPLLAVCVGMTIALPLRAWAWRGRAIAGIAALAMILSPGTRDYWYHAYHAQFRDFPPTYVSDAQLNTDHIEGYREEEFVAGLLRDQAHPVVYVLAPKGYWLNYYFALHGISSSAHWVGPGGWLRLYDAIDADLGGEFMNDLHVSAVLIDPTETIGGLGIPLERQIVRQDYCPVAMPENTFDLFVKCAIVSTERIKHA